MPFFTIITVVKNNFSTIERTILSVLSQEFDDYEYIIIDGKSNDGTEDVIKKYSNHKNVTIVSELDKGIYYAMNKGIEKSNGYWINLLNSDDYFINNEILQKYYDKIKTDKNIDILCSNMNILFEDKIVREMCPNPDYLKKNMQMNHPTWFVSIETYNTIGLFNINYKIAADYEFALRCLKNNKKISIIDDFVSINFALGGASNISIKSVIESYQIRKKYYLIGSLLNFNYLLFEFVDFLKSKIKKIIKWS